MLGEIWNIPKNTFRKSCELVCFACARQYGPDTIQRSTLYWTVLPLSSFIFHSADNIDNMIAPDMVSLTSGEHTRSIPEQTEVIHAVDEIILHPEFSMVSMCKFMCSYLMNNNNLYMYLTFDPVFVCRYTFLYNIMVSE